MGRNYKIKNFDPIFINIFQYETFGQKWLIDKEIEKVRKGKVIDNGSKDVEEVGMEKVIENKKPRKY